MLTAELSFFELPRELLAREPIEATGQAREDARLLLVRRADGSLEDLHIRDLPNLISRHDLLVLNNSQTIPSVLPVTTVDGQRAQLSLGSYRGNAQWHSYIEPRHLGTQDQQFLATLDDVEAQFVVQGDVPGVPGLKVIKVGGTTDLISLLLRIGQPVRSAYTRSPWDITKYQTDHGIISGSVEMPAAGRHITPRILADITRNGTPVSYITLHTGMSNLTVSEPSLEQHSMYDEAFTITSESADQVNSVRENGGFVFGVGTTVMRSLESTSDSNGTKPYTGWTDLFIYPGFQFHAVDRFMTNFHGPGTTRLALVMAFAGVELAKQAYFHAIERGYRFYEFGDAMLIV